MGKVLEIGIIGFVVGVIGTGIGGIISILVSDIKGNILSFIMGLSGGLMLSIICFDLLEEAFKITSLHINIIGLILGMIIMSLIEVLLKRRNRSGNKYRRIGFLLSIGVALHNFPEGLAIGSAFLLTKSLGIGVSIVIAIHNIPEGICMAAPMRMGGLNRLKVLLYTMLAGAPIGIGAYMGALLGNISQNFIGFSLSLAGGSMLYIACSELIPSAKEVSTKKIQTHGILMGFILGILITKM
ncbi:MAG: ZIP family metal transporter [Anaeromicrobium sp.]|jgi:ZIP family zinc transporter|uniref:ZIP family metal transporter n=1 Tax=Anaeromicrobium sp. TaxID=1929132 RepID=UPI0025DB77DF|nr:ZIP family metal transporter [Anaeromicrobium sp.]MCT4592753.1 ZIP family metal transporter [Anaeromicrobium sp.]